MGTVSGTIQLSIENAANAIIAAATSDKWIVDVNAQQSGVLRLVKSMSAFSWGTTIVVGFTPLDASTTRATLNSSESFGLYDWGRANRAARKVLTAAGSTLD